MIDRVQLAVAGALLFFRHRLPGHHAAVGQHAEGVGVVEQGHFAAAQGQAQTVEVELLVQAVDAQAARAVLMTLPTPTWSISQTAGMLYERWSAQRSICGPW